MKQELLELAASVIKTTVEEAQKNCKRVDEVNGYYFWSNTRGGVSVIINEDGEKLAAGSALSFEKLLAAFLEGKRN